MDTHGHEECAHEVGLPLLQAAMRRTGKEHWRLTAFHLGNWITDVQQLVDPVAAGGMKEKVIGAIDGLIGEIEEIQSSGWRAWLQQGAVNVLRQRRNEINRGFNWALNGGRSAPLNRALKSAFYLNGYFSFVHPANRGEPAKMDFSAFEHVFDNRYKQYYPHEHLDRWPMDDTSTPAFSRISSTVTPEGRGNGAATIQPHLYQYLRSDIQIAAGLITELDRDWARSTFSTASRWADDTNHEWNLKLAQLGHALHACEDFFAHTNFVELAINEMPADFQRRFKPTGRHSPAFGLVGLNAREIFERRLRRFSGNEEHPDAGQENWVVTGYFDGVDTIFSMHHAYEEIFGGDEGISGPPSGGSRTVKIGKLLLETIIDIKNRTSGNVTAEQARAAVTDAVQRAATGSTDPDVREAATALLDRAQVPQRVRSEFADAVAWFARSIPGTSLRLIDLMLTIKMVVDALSQPLVLIEWFFTRLPADVAHWVVESSAEPFVRAVGNVVSEKLGRFRIGCHSLIAKDYSVNETELTRLYNQAKSCAKAIHWYVIKTFTRWSEPQRIDICRAGPSDSHCNTSDTRNIVDWLELLESFLRHPGGTRRIGEHRWWEPVIEHPTDGWRNFPGFNGTNPGRSRELPHSMVFITAAQRDDQINTSHTLRQNGESAYDLSG